MLLTVDEIKEYLGISDSTYDDFITTQATILSDVIEDYCGRKFKAANYVQTFYKDDYEECTDNLSLFHYPINSITSIIEGTANITADVRVHKPTGNLENTEESFFSVDDSVVVTYNAGFSTIPSAIKYVLCELVGQAINKKKSGVSLSFGSDVQSISIPGTISVAFDYSLQSNERVTKFGTILGNYVNSLDPYRSHRAVIGSGKIEYVT